MLRSAKNLLDYESLRSIYYALFHSNLIFGLPIYSCTASKNLKKITSLQKSAIRVITKSKYNAHTEPLFKKCSILPIDKLIYFFNIQIMQQYKQGFLPPSFNHTWITNAERRNDDIQIILRNDQNLSLPFSRLSSSLRQPLRNLHKTWIEFKNETIKIVRNKLEFKSLLKKHLLEELSSTINCTRLLCPSCHLNINTDNNGS